MTPAKKQEPREDFYVTLDCAEYCLEISVNALSFQLLAPDVVQSEPEPGTNRRTGEVKRKNTEEDQLQVLVLCKVPQNTELLEQKPLPDGRPLKAIAGLKSANDPTIKNRKAIYIADDFVQSYSLSEILFTPVLQTDVKPKKAYGQVYKTQLFMDQRLSYKPMVDALIGRSFYLEDGVYTVDPETIQQRRHLRANESN